MIFSWNLINVEITDSLTFFHAFIEFGSTTLYERYVNAPLTFEDAKRHMLEFIEAGLDGNVGSTDCTHITSEKIEYK